MSSSYILTPPSPTPEQKMHSRLDAEKTWVQQHTHMKNECLIVLFEQFDMIWEGKNCNPLRKKLDTQLG